MEVPITKTTYFSRQILIIINQIAVITYLSFMAARGIYIENADFFRFLLLTLLFFDAAYISYKNIKGTGVLNRFVFLLLLLGWQFLLSLFDCQPLSGAASLLLLPVCFYQSVSFIQVFLFQESSYRGKNLLLAFWRITCTAAVICFFVSERTFSTAYQMQVFLSAASLLFIGVLHRKRVIFVLKSQRKQLLFSLTLTVIPFLCYVFVYARNSVYLANLGNYLPVMLVFISIHSIVFRNHPRQAAFFTLSGGPAILLLLLGLAGLTAITSLFRIPLMAILLGLHITALLALVYNALFYLKVSRQPPDDGNFTDRRRIYAYSLEQIKREERLKKEFSNYLHDDILQDLLSVKNMMYQADRREIRQLLGDTLGELSSSIRLQMQAYHPDLIKSLTLKENIQHLLDTLKGNQNVTIRLDCENDLFLVDPYNLLVYRMIKELVTNSLKHSFATQICVTLIQENGRISLNVTDDGTGFRPFSPQNTSHHGLASIQEQVCLLNGTMDIRDAAGGGTEISITMPMNGEESYESFIDR